MVFASPIFLALFLPVTLALYFLAPRAWRNGALMAASLAFYAWGEAAYVPLVLGSVLANWALGLAIERAPDGRARKARLAVAVAANLSVLAVFKYANFAVDNANAALAALGLAPIALAAGPAAARHLVLHLPRDLLRRRRLQAQRQRRPAPAGLRALHPALPAAHRRPDHPLARHRRAARPRATSGSPTSRTARAASRSGSARRC